MRNRNGVGFSRNLRPPKLKSYVKLWSHRSITNRKGAPLILLSQMSLTTAPRITRQLWLQLRQVTSCKGAAARCREICSVCKSWSLITLTTTKWDYWSPTREALTASFHSRSSPHLRDTQLLSKYRRAILAQASLISNIWWLKISRKLSYLTTYLEICSRRKERWWS